MDAIFRGILLSDYNPDFKKALLEKTVNQAAVHQDAKPLACHGIFQIVFDVVGKCNTQFEIDLAHEVYRPWANHHSAHLRKFLTEETLSRYFHNDSYTNKVPLLMLVLEALQHSTDDPKLNELVQKHALTVLELDHTLNVAAVLSRLWVDVCSDRLVPLTKMMIRCLGRCRWPCDSKNVMDLVRNVQTVSSFIGKLWSRMPPVEIKTCLMEIHAMLALEEESYSCICLASLVPYVETSYLEELAKHMIFASDSSPAKLQLVLSRIINWLRWPTKNVDQIVISIMRILESAKYFSVLIQVTKDKAEQIFCYLTVPDLRESALPVILYMMLSYQHSPDIFHKLIVRVPDLLRKLTIEKTEASKHILNNLVEVVCLLMQFHSGFPELYDPILRELQNFPAPNLQAMKDFMLQRKWGSYKLNYASSMLSPMPRSETGKTGLINLGNTCYMNSVLQALFMNDEFRTKVLISPLHERELVLFKLQEVFAFLLHTKRSAYSPSKFLDVSRPSWFEAGHQQDCSEFLRYLFDVMHEQECRHLSNAHASSLLSLMENAEADGGDQRCMANTSLDTISCQCLIHKLFGGELTVTYKCLHCQQVSIQKENFIDLSLALPECQDEAKYIHRRELKAGRAEENMNMTGVEYPSLVDIPSTDHVVNASVSSGEVLQLEDLIHHYISPEKLEGENRYHCNYCNTLREAQKMISISSAPKYLTLTLLRFAYDIQTHQRVKVLRNVAYPEILTIPVTSPTNKDGETSAGKVAHKYVLYGVIIHSGISSDCGHYYAYARHSDSAHQSAFEKIVTDRTWNLFNDSRVSFSDYESFANLSQRFAHDTAYLLFYCRYPPDDIVPESERHKPSDVNLMTVREDLLEAVWKDNLAYALELEEAQMRQQTSAAKSNSNWKDFDDQQPPGSCGDGSGFGSFSATFVC